MHAHIHANTFLLLVMSLHVELYMILVETELTTLADVSAYECADVVTLVWLRFVFFVHMHDADTHQPPIDDTFVGRRHRMIVEISSNFVIDGSGTKHTVKMETVVANNADVDAVAVASINASSARALNKLYRCSIQGCKVTEEKPKLR